MADRILVTGTGSGLGQALLEQLGTSGLTRADDPAALRESTPYDAIVHCAFDHSPKDDAEKIEANLNLFEAVRSIPCRRFVYISSIDVYPKGKGPKLENQQVLPAPTDDSYRTIKLACEARLENSDENNLILRPTALLGKTARPNSLIRMLQDPNCSLSLAPDSRFNYVTHHQLGAFILRALHDGLSGVYNIATTGSLRLREVAEILATCPQYGKFHYDVGDIDNRKARSVLPELARSTRDIVEEFMKAHE